MTSHVPALLASRFVGLDDGTSLDLATGHRVWIERRVLDAAIASVWPGIVGRLWRLWHPALVPCVDFGFLTASEWFEAYSLQERDARIESPRQAASAPAFLRDHDVACRLVSLPSRRSTGLIPALPDGDRAASDVPGGPGLGMRLLPRSLEAHVVTALDDRRARGPRLWSVDAPDGSGWGTTWRLLAREARLRGYVPIHASVLESAVRRHDGRRTSWLALLDGQSLVVLHDRHRWQLPDRYGLARLLIRLGGVDAVTTVVLDVLRGGRPRPAAHALDPLTADQLVAALWVSTDSSPQWLRARAIAVGADGWPGRFVAQIARKLGLQAISPMVHERAPGYVASEAAAPAIDLDPSGIVGRARRLAATGRTALAQRHVQRAAWAAARRGGHLACARLLAESARLAAARGDLGQSRSCLRDAGRLVPASQVEWLIAASADVAEQWVRQAALLDAEYLLQSALNAARVLDSPHPRLTALLITCLCWQARWADARHVGDAADPPPIVAAARVWPCLELRDVTGAMSGARTARAVETPDEAVVPQLRLDIAGGAVDALTVAASATLLKTPMLSLADDDRVLLPFEGLLKHGRVLSATQLRALRLLTRRDVPRLVRARARLILTLSAIGLGDRSGLEADVARVARGTGSRALLPGQSTLSAWPSEADRETPSMLHDLVAVLRACQAHDDPRAALPRVGQLLQARLQCSAVLVVGLSSQATASLVRLGQRDLSALAERAVDLNQTVVVDEPGATDAAVPVRLGEAVVGALACHWAMPDRTLQANHRVLLEAAAIAVAPTVRLAVEVAHRPARGPEPSSLLGLSPSMARVRAAVEAASRVPFTVLVEGESGSGKELVAREIHRLGPRRSRAFCAVNCAALTDDLCEAELFGHARGAFTGAVGERAGLFEDADGGTLFLDEVSELSPRAQAKLLRAIQEGEIRRLGETRSRRVDVRLVAASNRRLAEAVAAGAFRADLRYRLDVVHITLPPLRERPDDVPLLARHFWERAAERVGSHARLAPETLAALARYDWPGNVRELQNALSALAVYAPRHGTIPASALSQAVTGGPPLGGVTLEQARRLVDERLVRAALAQTGGHRGRAASALGVTRQGLAKLVDRLRLDRATDPTAPSP